MEKRLFLYLDTSVISHLDQPHKPDEMAVTLAFWKMIQAGEYEIAISDITLDELELCHEPKLSRLIRLLSRIRYELLPASTEVEKLAEAYVGARSPDSQT